MKKVRVIKKVRIPTLAPEVVRVSPEAVKRMLEYFESISAKRKYDKSDKLLAVTIDLDGTLGYGQEDNISPINVEALRIANKLGVVIAFSTGRQASMAFKMALSLPVDARPRYICGDNGATKCKLNASRDGYVLVHTDRIDSTKAAACIRKAMELDSNCACLVSGIIDGRNKVFVPHREARKDGKPNTDDFGVFYDNVATKSQEKVQKGFYHMEDGKVCIYAPGSVEHNKPIEMVKVGFDFRRHCPEEKFGQMENFCKRQGFEFLVMKYGKIELTNSGIDKGSALLGVLAMENTHGNRISPEEATHYGDDRNDIPGFKAVAKGRFKGRLMKNASSAARIAIELAGVPVKEVGPNHLGGVGEDFIKTVKGQEKVTDNYPKQVEEISQTAAKFQQTSPDSIKRLDKRIAQKYTYQPLSSL